MAGAPDSARFQRADSARFQRAGFSAPIRRAGFTTHAEGLLANWSFH